MISEVRKVTVKYNSQTVGYLAKLEESIFGFQYDEN